MTGIYSSIKVKYNRKIKEGCKQSEVNHSSQEDDTDRKSVICIYYMKQILEFWQEIDLGVLVG